MEFNKETFEKALKANEIVRYQQYFEAVVKSYLELENQALRIHDIVGRSEQLAISALQKIERVHSESYSAQVARNALKEIANYR